MVFPVTRGQKTLTRKWIRAKFAMTHLRTGHGVQYKRATCCVAIQQDVPVMRPHGINTLD